MALPQTDSDWLLYLSMRHDAERPELEQFNDYYEGTIPLTYMHPEIFREISDRIQPVVIAWPQLVVDSVEERLDIEGFRLPDEDSEEKDLRRVWQANNLDEGSQQAHVDALAMRRAYVTIGSNEDDADTPLVTAESPLEMYADIDPRTRQVRAALRRVTEYDGVTPLNQRYATLYLPNSTVWYDWDGGWKVVDRDDHNLGRVPVVPIVNRARLRQSRRARNDVQVRYGQSELAPILPLSNAANKIATDMMLAAEFLALPLRGFFGLGPEDLVDEDGNKMTALQAIMGRLLTISDTDGKEFQFPAASLNNFHETLKQLAQLVASIAGLPPAYLGQATTQPASADAIRSSESRLVKRAERKQRGFGGGWEEVARFVKRFQNGDWDPRFLQLEAVWRDASTPTIAQRADATVKLRQQSIISLRQAREDLGYTEPQITRMEADDDAEAARDPIGVLGRQLADEPPAPGQPPAADVTVASDGDAPVAG